MTSSRPTLFSSPFHRAHNNNNINNDDDEEEVEVEARTHYSQSRLSQLVPKRARISSPPPPPSSSSSSSSLPHRPPPLVILRSRGAPTSRLPPAVASDVEARMNRVNDTAPPAGTTARDMIHVIDLNATSSSHHLLDPPLVDQFTIHWFPDKKPSSSSRSRVTASNDAQHAADLEGAKFGCVQFKPVASWKKIMFWSPPMITRYPSVYEPEEFRGKLEYRLDLSEEPLPGAIPPEDNPYGANLFTGWIIALDDHLSREIRRAFKVRTADHQPCFEREPQDADCNRRYQRLKISSTERPVLSYEDEATRDDVVGSGALVKALFTITPYYLPAVNSHGMKLKLSGVRLCAPPNNDSVANTHWSSHTAVERALRDIVGPDPSDREMIAAAEQTEQTEQTQQTQPPVTTEDVVEDNSTTTTITTSSTITSTLAPNEGSA